MEKKMKQDFLNFKSSKTGATDTTAGCNNE